MKLGFVISETTMSRYVPRLPAEPDQVKRWERTISARVFARSSRTTIWREITKVLATS